MQWSSHILGRSPEARSWLIEWTVSLDMFRRRRDIINWEVDDAARIEFWETDKSSAQELIGSLNVCP